MHRDSTPDLPPRRRLCFYRHRTSLNTMRTLRDYSVEMCQKCKAGKFPYTKITHGGRTTERNFAGPLPPVGGAFDLGSGLQVWRWSRRANQPSPGVSDRAKMRIQYPARPGYLAVDYQHIALEHPPDCYGYCYGSDRRNPQLGKFCLPGPLAQFHLRSLLLQLCHVFAHAPVGWRGRS